MTEVLNGNYEHGSLVIAGRRPGFILSTGALVATWIFAYFQYLPATMEANTDIVPEVEGVYFDWVMWDALYIASIWGLMASITALVLVSLLTQKINTPRPLVDIDGNPLDTHGWFAFSRQRS